jgi:hypothetical protein
MTLTRENFEHFLDLNGADPARWPQAQRQAAERLVASDPVAAAALARARQLASLIAREPVAADAAAARILRAIETRPLPRQRRPLLWGRWPAELLTIDFAPAWPRLGALATVAVLGFVIGLTDLAGPITAGASGEEGLTVVADNDLGDIVFAPDPLPGSRP